MEYKQFIFKLEWERSIEKLTTLQKGILLQVFYDYHNGRDLDYNDDVMVEMLWLNLLPNIERMNDKYRTSVENGRKGGVPKGTVPWNKVKQQSDSEPNTNPTQSEANQPRTLKEKVEVKVKEKVEVEVKEKVEVEVKGEETTPPFFSTTTPSNTSDEIDTEIEEVFCKMFVDFEEDENNYHTFLKYWWEELSIQEKDDSVYYSSRFLKYSKKNKRSINLYWYLKDKKFNWSTIRNLTY